MLRNEEIVLNKKKDRIDFFKYLVCPDEIRSNSDQFEEWVKNCIQDCDSEKVLEYRTFLILDHYDIFRKLYDYTTNSYLYDDMNDIHIDFPDGDVKITIKFESYKVESTLLSEIENHFSSLEDFGFQLDSVEDSPKHNKVTLSFSR